MTFIVFPDVRVEGKEGEEGEEGEEVDMGIRSGMRVDGQ